LVSFSTAKNQDFGTPQQIQILSLGRVISQPWEAILHYTSTQQKRRTIKSGIDLTLGIIPHLLQVDFDLLFLAYLIHVFRISELFCKAIKLRLEDEPRVRLWRLFHIM
jgi:hypothetical protein